MKFSLELPTTRVEKAEEFVAGDAIGTITRAAADAGFAAVFVTDHPAPDARWLDAGGHHALDPFVALTAAATAHPSIRLHTNIYVAAYRNPFLTAKSVQSLAVVSGDRLILGVAAGYLKAEFAALGVDFARRGALLDDALEVLDEVLDGGDVARNGPGYSARGVRVRPVPAGGRPPIWVGGNSRAAIERAARFEGWAPFHTGGYAKTSRTTAIESVEELRAAIAVVHELVAARETAGPFDVCWSAGQLNDARSSVDERLARIAELQQAGVTWATISVPAVDRAELLAGIATFGREVISPVARGLR